MVSVGGLLGFCLGWIFIVTLNSLIKGVSFHKEARRTKNSYLDVLLLHNKMRIYALVCKKLGLSWLMSSRFVEILSYLFKVLLLLICIALCITLILLYNYGYKEFFNMRW